MIEKELHIVAHDVPWPADYGGVIDLFYKIKTLHSIGVKIHLHCFLQKGRVMSEELKNYCTAVNYYPRKKNIFSFSLSIPFIVKSRRSSSLLKNLSKDNFPILLEGIHCTYLLGSNQLKDRKIKIRLHNVEHIYYKYLGSHESNFFKRLYFYFESWVLKKYETRLSQTCSFISVSRADTAFYKKNLCAKSVVFLPVFLPWSEVSCKEGRGCFCLYHGNLGINENEKVALWLLAKIFDNLSIPLVIAGKNPSKKLQNAVHTHANACLVANPNDKEMLDLISKAQINILPSFNNTGVKLKLLYALFNGRYCMVNLSGVAGSELEQVCHIADDIHSMKQMVQQLYHIDFTKRDTEKRKQHLNGLYNNKKNAAEIVRIFWP